MGVIKSLVISEKKFCSEQEKLPYFEMRDRLHIGPTDLPATPYSAAELR